jgi:hypothetical protein
MLTGPHKAIVKAYILSDPSLASQASDGNGLGFIRDHLNSLANPAFIVWKTLTTSQEYRQSIMETVGAATQLDALTVSKRDSLFWVITGETRPSIPATRAAIDDFCGSQNTLKLALASAHKRSATVIEKILSAGTGSDVAPATLGFERAITSDEVDAARRS